MANEEPILIRVFNGTKLLLSTKRSLAGITEEVSLKWGDGRIPRIYFLYFHKSFLNEGQFQWWLSLMERRRSLSPDLAAVFPGERFKTTSSEPERVLSCPIEETRIIRVRWGDEFLETTKQSMADIEEEASLKWSNGEMIPRISMDNEEFGNEPAFQYYVEKFCTCRPTEVVATFPRDIYQSWKQHTEKINERFTLNGFKEIRVKRREEIMVTRFTLLNLIREEASVFWGSGRLRGFHIYCQTAQAVLWNQNDFQKWLTNTWEKCSTSELLAVYPGEKFPTQRVQHKIISADKIIRVKHGDGVMLSSRRSLADIQEDASFKWTESSFYPHIIPRIIIDNESQQEITNEFDFDEWLDDWDQNPTDLVAVFPGVWNCVTRLLSRVLSALSYDKEKNE
ncbi:uncharacterized protein LOC119076983 [Bradysia coprophila]|uniref:uncharacterized protein LOC119076983 n=1 Tax=Bradysia coprophila TaxID=38358 RepID=UPI00187DBEA5|nr:uncharacterized protein LOC119076983 [Bradysia coprophila]XP_037039994.1 uncharacterized protein LOC119076983 [Bradysia coprophila]